MSRVAAQVWARLGRADLRRTVHQVVLAALLGPGPTRGPQLDGDTLISTSRIFWRRLIGAGEGRSKRTGRVTMQTACAHRWLHGKSRFATAWTRSDFSTTRKWRAVGMGDFGMDRG